jgi:hypothetical protein
MIGSPSSRSSPPNGNTPVIRCAASQRGKTTIFAHLITTYAPDPIDDQDAQFYPKFVATWETPPRFGQPLQIRVTNQYSWGIARADLQPAGPQPAVKKGIKESSPATAAAGAARPPSASTATGKSRHHTSDLLL